jgi:hypothetical protein
MDSWPKTLTLIGKMVQVGIIAIIFKLTGYKQSQNKKLATLMERPICNNVKDLMHNCTHITTKVGCISLA